MACYFMNFYQIGWFSSICLLHDLVIFRYITKKLRSITEIFQSLIDADVNLKPRFLIMGGYYIEPGPSTPLLFFRKNKL